MKKVIILFIAVVFLFAACTKAEQETVAEELTKDDTQEAVTEEPTAETVTEEPSEEPVDETEEATQSLPMSVAVVVCIDGYAPDELHPVMDAIAVAGYTPYVVSSEMGSANGYDEFTEVNYTFADLLPEELRGIVLIGGSDSLWENTDLHNLINGVHDLDRVTAGICLNSVTLAKAGVIGEGDTACWYNCDIADPEMEALGVVDSGQPVTINGNIITGDGPESAEEFAAAVVVALDALS